jgi:hypothetical protein
MKAWYTIIEFNTAVKPYAFLHFFESMGFDEACYIDPDILVFSGFTEVFGALRNHSCVLTPHITAPLQDGKEPSDLTIMKSGVYNLGFLGLRNDSDGRRLAKWWADRCFFHCRVDIAGNMFTDQRWMDLAPTFVSNPYILRHPGYNVAYWNLPHREVVKAANGKWLVNGKRLVFFHFSGIDPDKPAQFSKHQNRYSPNNLGLVNELCDLYRSKVLKNKWRKYNKERYAFGFFPDGRRIDDVMRHWITRSIDEGALDPKANIQLASDFFDRRDEAAKEKGASLTRYMYQYWIDRRDLRAAFDVFTSEGLNGYFNWFLDGDAAAQGVDAKSLAAAQELRGGAISQVPRVVARQMPPWKPVSDDIWSVTSHEAIDALAVDIIVDAVAASIRVPKQAALLWERRADLQSAFNISIAERLLDYLCWSITSGSSDGSIDIGCLSPQFVSGFREISEISKLYNDVPLTEGMILVRGVSASRESLVGWQRFPVERLGRLAHGLWFSVIAPKLFKWPQEFIAPVIQYFRTPTEISVDGFSLSCAAVAVWELRPDLQRMFPLGEKPSVWRYLRWLLVNGLRELGLTIDEFDPRLRSFLLSQSPRFEGINQLLEMLHDYRPDLRARFDLTSKEGRGEFIVWADAHLRSSTEGLSLGEALASQAAPSKKGVRRVYKAKIALSGSWTDTSGRGEDIRGSAKALDALGFRDYIVVDLVGEVCLTPHGKALEPETYIEVNVNIVHTNADTTVENAFLLKRLNVHAQKTVGFWAWELEWLPTYWRHAYSFYDEIWASTKFAAAAFMRDDARPVKLLPMTVADPERGPVLSRSELGLPEDVTLFFFMFDFRSYASRKNPEGVIRAFLAAFPAGDESVYLLIKTSGAAAMPADAARLRELVTDPRIEVRDERLERHQILDLIRSANAFVSLHRSEGFGRAPAEAMMLCVPVIVTDYSGSADYAKADNALLVDYELKRVDVSEYPGVTGQQWAEPSVTTAARHLRWIYEHPNEARLLGRRGRAQIKRLYGPKTVGKAMLRELRIGYKT